MDVTAGKRRHRATEQVRENHKRHGKAVEDELDDKVKVRQAEALAQLERVMDIAVDEHEDEQTHSRSEPHDRGEADDQDDRAIAGGPLEQRQDTEESEEDHRRANDRHAVATDR